MARGRMLNKKISLDMAVNQLSCDTARLLFTWLISHLDANGCYYGEPSVVKNLVFPLRNDLRITKISGFMEEMEKLGLIIRYKLSGNSYLYFPKFIENQRGLRPEREAKSDIPSYPLLRSNAGVMPEICRSNAGVTPLEVEGEGKGREIEVKEKINTPYSPPGDSVSVISVFENELITELTPAVEAQVAGAIEEFGAPKVIEAINLASGTEHKKRTWRYVAGILENWRNGKTKPAQNGKPDEDPDRFIKGRYGHLVRRARPQAESP